MLIYVAPEVVPPQVPDAVPKPPSVKLLTEILAPLLMLAWDDPEGAILKFPVTDMLVAGMVFNPLPEKIRLLYET